VLERLQKVLSRAGIASRRKAEELIKQGRVKVDGVVVTQLGFKVDPERSVIEVDGMRVKVDAKPIYIALYKPRGYVTTRSDPHVPFEKTVFSLLPPEYRKLHYVGRLDKDSEGLLLLTNDGSLTHLVTHPRHELEKRYIVTVEGSVEQRHIKQLEEGILLDDGRKHKAKVRLLSSGKHTTTMLVCIREGKKRQIRIMMEKVGLRVKRLIRVSIGPIKLGKLRQGEFRHLSEDEVEALYKAAKKGLAQYEKP
jgi:23S rRNA pseudouridine2605 synthase